MDETLDLVLSDERITFIEAIFLLKSHLKSLDKNRRSVVIKDLQEAFHCPSYSGEHNSSSKYR